MEKCVRECTVDYEENCQVDKDSVVFTDPICRYERSRFAIAAAASAVLGWLLYHGGVDVVVERAKSIVNVAGEKLRLS
jgi:hypothetical protein